SFAGDWDLSGVGLQDVQGQTSEYGLISGGVLLSASVSVLEHEDVELPVKVVFYGPVAAHVAQDFLGRGEPGEGEVPGLVRGGLLADAAPDLGPGDGDEAFEGVLARALLEGNDEGAAPFVASVRRVLGLGDGRLGRGGGGEGGGGLCGELGLVGLDGDEVVA